MAISLQAPDIRELKPHITVFGVGGAGGNAVNNMITSGLEGVDFVVANAENAAAGAGITGAIAKTLLSSGVDAITLGPWQAWPNAGTEDVDPYSRARLARTRLFDAMVFSAAPSPHSAAASAIEIAVGGP